MGDMHNDRGKGMDWDEYKNECKAAESVYAVEILVRDGPPSSNKPFICLYPGGRNNA